MVVIYEMAVTIFVYSYNYSCNNLDFQITISVLLLNALSLNITHKCDSFMMDVTVLMVVTGGTNVTAVMGVTD